METRKIDYKFIKKCVREVRDDSEWVKGCGVFDRNIDKAPQVISVNLLRKRGRGCGLKKNSTGGKSAPNSCLMGYFI